MKFPVKTTVAILVLGIGGYAGFRYTRAWWKARNKPHYRQAAAIRGDIVSVVNATGTVQPVLRVPVGASVSGPIRSPGGAAESLAADATGTNITASYDATTGVLTLSGRDSVANYERVLRTVAYSNSSETPDTTPRLITFVANDGTRDGNVSTATVTIVARSDAAAVDLAAGESTPRNSRTLSGAVFATSLAEAGEGAPIADVFGDGDAAGPDLDAGDAPDGNGAEFAGGSGEDGRLVPNADGDAPVLDLDADDSSGRAGADFGTTFTGGGEPVPVADTDAVLSHVGSTELSSLRVTITNRLDAGKLAYYNQEVKKGEFLAEIDPKIYEAAVARDRATLKTRLAEVDRVNALLGQAKAEERRAEDLKKMEQQYRSEAGVDEVKFISDTELDQITANCASLEAQLKVAEAAVEQARGALENSMANLDYTKITSPVDGIVIDRKVDEGQTLAAQFQTPELFVVAPNMREMMHVEALVDEADIGMILKAEREDRPVEFTVDAYPDDLFQGKVFQVRMNPTSVQNVVTYPVVVEVSNPELKLLPGMTANLSFETGKHEDVLKIPNAAIRFYPKPEQVRPKDRELLEGAYEEDSEEGENAMEEQLSAAQRAEARKKGSRRHVWVVEGDYLKAAEITTGLMDAKWTEMVSGDLKKGQKLVTGAEARKP